MSEFNIENSKIEQLSDSGNNYKITGASGNVAISQQGGTVQTVGDENKVQVGQTESFWKLLWGKVKAGWKVVAGWFGG